MHKDVIYCALKFELFVMFLIVWMLFIFENVSSEALSENKENEYRSNKLSIGFHVLLPLAGLGLLLGRRYIFEKILLQLDRKYLTVLCPSFIKRESIVKWACYRLPPTWSSNSMKTLSGGIKELWTDGSLLCTLINTAIPGACPNPHRHWKQPPVHGQALAYKYFEIAPIFSNEDLKRNLTACLERKFIRYLNEVQQSINKVTENVDYENKISNRYIVRGMGLFSGEQNKKTTFYIYLNENYEDDDDDDGSIIIQIKGPYGTYGEAIAPKIISKSCKHLRNKRRKQGRRQSIQFIENLMQSNTWNFTRSQRKNTNDGIQIETATEKDRIRVSYTPSDYGMYELNMISNGELLKGCPFNVHIFINELDESFDEKKENSQKLKHVRKPVEQIKINVLSDLLENEELKQKADLRSSFNFKEVVDEITKNGTIFKDILGHTPEPETCNLEILSEAVSKNEATNVEKLNKNTEDGTFQSLSVEISVNEPNDSKTENVYESIIPVNIIESASGMINSAIPERNDQKIVSEKLKINGTTTEQILLNIKPTERQQLEETKFEDKKQLAGIKDNYNSLSKHNSDSSNNFKINNAKSASIFANKNLINESEKTQLELTQSSVLEPKYINTVNINKIKIPEIFTDTTVKKIDYQLEDKYFKNILNESNKYTRHVSNIGTDYNRHKHKLQNYDVNKRDIEKYKDDIDKTAINPKFFHQESLEDTKDTSPICLKHIVTEVEIIPKTVAEKRKIFAQESLGSLIISSSKNSSFSDENDKESIEREYRRNSVINVFNNLEDSINNTLTESYSLCSTVSLPNLSLDSEYSLMSVKVRKEFWESFSSRSSSTVSTKSPSPKKNSVSELERNKLIWKKPGDNYYNNVKSSEHFYKSADDILSMASHQENYIKYKSADDSLDKCVVLSIQERKRLLLKTFYEKEITDKQLQRKKVTKRDTSILNNHQSEEKTTHSTNINLYFTPLAEKIRKYNSALEMSTKKSQEIVTSDIEHNKKISNASNTNIRKVENLNKEKFSKERKVSKEEKSTKRHSHFKKAINYFKNLEMQSQDKAVKPKKKLNMQNTRNNQRYLKTGSLNLPNISQKFLINNLYQDVFGNKNDSFRGTPNKSALVKALATFSRNQAPLNDNEDDIQYDIFKKLAKPRKRKALTSIFDIHY